MTEEQLSKLNPEPNSSKFITDSTQDLQTENRKLKNVLTRVLTHAIVYRGVPEFDHVIEVVESALGEK